MCNNMDPKKKLFCISSFRALKQVESCFQYLSDKEDIFTVYDFA